MAPPRYMSKKLFQDIPAMEGQKANGPKMMLKGVFQVKIKT